MELMIGCMAETAMGLSASVQLALGTGFSSIDLDSDHLLAPHRASAVGTPRRTNGRLSAFVKSGWCFPKPSAKPRGMAKAAPSMG